LRILGLVRCYVAGLDPRHNILIMVVIRIYQKYIHYRDV
jgi:hypothetical protein